MLQLIHPGLPPSCISTTHTTPSACHHSLASGAALAEMSVSGALTSITTSGSTGSGLRRAGGLGACNSLARGKKLRAGLLALYAMAAGLGLGLRLGGGNAFRGLDFPRATHAMSVAGRGLPRSTLSAALGVPPWCQLHAETVHRHLRTPYSYGLGLVLRFSTLGVDALDTARAPHLLPSRLGALLQEASGLRRRNRGGTRASRFRVLQLFIVLVVAFTLVVLRCSHVTQPNK